MSRIRVKKTPIRRTADPQKPASSSLRSIDPDSEEGRRIAAQIEAELAAKPKSDDPPPMYYAKWPRAREEEDE